MTPKVISEVFRNLQEQLLKKTVLKLMRLTKKRMQALLKNEIFRASLGEVLEGRKVACEDILILCQDIMEELSPKTPKEGWLSYIYFYVRKG